MNEDEKIYTFNDLMHFIAYDWGHSGEYSLRKMEGGYRINKTYIFPTELRYKTGTYPIMNPIVYEKLEKFYELLQVTELEKALYE